MTESKQLEILKKYEKWIYKLSFKYGAMSNNYLEPEDLQSIGQMAALEAQGKYDPNNKGGAKLNTYTMNHIKYRIQSAIRDCGDLNSSQQNAMIMISAMLKRLDQDEATPEEISAHSQDYYPKGSSYHWTLKQATDYLELYNIRRYSTSHWLNDETGMAEKTELRCTADTVEQKLNDHQEQTILYNAIKQLKSQWREVVLSRLDEKTLEEVGREQNLTRERIRQIEEKAMELVIKIAKDEPLSHFELKHLTKFENTTLNQRKRMLLRSRADNVIDVPGSLELTKVVNRTTYEDLPAITFYMVHGTTIFPEEYELAPGCFKIFQYLKENTSNNKTKVSKNVKCSQKSLYDNVATLREYGMVDTVTLAALPRNDWDVNCDQPEPKKALPPIAPVVPPVVIEPPTNGNKVEDLQGRIYTVSEDLGGRYEVYDPSIGKYTVLKQNEIKRVF
tara:strand:- start:34864 stop:36204 length:1341 start_codon:yes stop_codon:yes gene_type:complete